MLLCKENNIKQHLYHYIKKIVLLITSVFLITSCHQKNNTKAIIGFNKLISCKETLNIIKHNIANYKIIDIRPIEDYEKGHILNAINTWRPEYENKKSNIKGLMADKKQMEMLLQKWGVLKSDTLILYDGRGNSNSCRLWWILKQYGFNNVKILNGSFINWKRLNYPLDYTTSKTEVSQINLAHFKKQNYANITDVKNHIKTHGILLDSRTLKEFNGDIKKPNTARAGHIPNAIRFDWSELVNIGVNGDGKFKETHTIKEKLEQINITKNDDIIVYCQSGVRSACVTFVLSEILGYTNVKNYDGSWLEWANTDLDIE